jgi:mono/diheme cytochrome c family protein
LIFDFTRLSVEETGMSATTLNRFLALILIAATSQAQAQRASTGNAEAGAQLFFQHGCYQCHGYSGYGKQSLHNPDSGALKTEDAFIFYLRQRADIAPVRNSAAMPNYSVNTVSDAAARNLYAYILSMPEDNPDVEDVPTFQSILESANAPYRP